MKTDLLKKLKLGLLTASAAGVLLAAQASVAQQDQQEQEGDIPNASTGTIFPDRSDASEEFDEADRDGDGLLRWQEIQASLGDEIEQRGLDRQDVFAEYDESNDQLLNAEEFEEFHSAMIEQDGGAQQAANQAETSESDAWASEDSEQESDAWSAEQDSDDFAQQSESDQQQAQAGAAAGGAAAGQESEQAYEQETARAEQEGLESEQQQAEQQQQGSQEQRSAGAGQAPAADDALLSMSIEDVNNADVVNSRGEEIGTVSRVVRNDETGELALVVEAGGTAGVGASEVVAPISDVMQLSENRLVWETTLAPDEMADIPEFDATRYSELSEDEFETLEEASRG